MNNDIFYGVYNNNAAGTVKDSSPISQIGPPNTNPSFTRGKYRGVVDDDTISPQTGI